jgi:hypothetical protein
MMPTGTRSSLIRLVNGQVRMLSPRATHRDERLVALLRVASGETIQAAAGVFTDRPRSRKHGDRKRLDRRSDTYNRHWGA